MSVHTYVKFAGDRPLTGGVTAAGYGGCFEALSYQPIVGNPRGLDRKTNGRASGMRITFPLDSYSVQLMSATSLFKAVTVQMVKDDYAPQLIMQMQMTNVTIATCSSSGDSLALVLACEAIEIRYYSYDMMTGKSAPVMPGYNIKQNVAI